ncbi:hypothetical protein CYJ76_11190 [Kytococcus schroeteri]|uniref:Uncharacterized protein n=1 Tax=Kytococcus schroeteri TaxID=138300 RepID=A0A2I1P839_9MICO|nr:hypothetical protein CYJ76_11190 [Kytococcus schroeteri]
MLGWIAWQDPTPPLFTHAPERLTGYSRNSRLMVILLGVVMVHEPAATEGAAVGRVLAPTRAATASAARRMCVSL